MPTWKELRMDSGGRCLGLSADGSGMLTTSGFVPFQTRHHRPLAEQDTEQSKTSAQTQLSVAYWISDGWVWRVGRDVGPRRVFWLPPLYREIDPVNLYGHEIVRRGHMATGHHAIAFKTKDTRFVVLDLSGCFSERRKSACMTERAHEAYEYYATAPS